MKRSFTVQAFWDADAGVFVSESDIDGLHIEAATIEEFEEIMHDVEVDRRISACDFLAKAERG